MRKYFPKEACFLMSIYNRGQQFLGQINEAINENRNLVHAVLKKHYSHLKPWQTDEAFADGILGLWAAIKQYEPGKQSFKTYATTQIRHHIRRGIVGRQDPLVRHLECEKYTIQQFMELGLDQGRSHNEFDRTDTNELVNLLIDQLTEHEKEIVYNRFWKGWSIEKIAQHYDITFWQSHYLVANILTKLKQHSERIDAV